MTPGELKFALTLESKLNSLPDPEYRQLVVEALMIFSFVTKSSGVISFRSPLLVRNVIDAAQKLFLEDQVSSPSRVVKSNAFHILWVLCFDPRNH